MTQPKPFYRFVERRVRLRNDFVSPYISIELEFRNQNPPHDTVVTTAWKFWELWRYHPMNAAHPRNIYHGDR
jgi:hypothetical protein